MIMLLACKSKKFEIEKNTAAATNTTAYISFLFDAGMH